VGRARSYVALNLATASSALSAAIALAMADVGLAVSRTSSDLVETVSGEVLEAVVVLPERAALEGRGNGSGHDSAGEACRDLEDVMMAVGWGLARNPAPKRIVIVGPSGDPAGHDPVTAALDYGVEGLAWAVREEARGRCSLVAHVRPGSAPIEQVASVVAQLAAGSLRADHISLSASRLSDLDD
jgi:hypothetical protein